MLTHFWQKYDFIYMIKVSIYMLRIWTLSFQLCPVSFRTFAYFKIMEHNIYQKNRVDTCITKQNNSRYGTQ